MAKRPLKHQVEAARRVAAEVNQRAQGAMDASRARGNPALAMYGREGPKGGPEKPTVRSEQTNLTPTDVKAIERALGSGAKAHAVLSALKQAGLVGGGPKSSPPAQREDRGAMSPIGGRAV
jgi:hypothetical protein